MTNQPNVSWPGWEVVRLIGRGSFGAVYEIRRNLFGEEESAALKVISIPQNKDDIEDLYNDGYTVEDVTMRFQGYLEDIIRKYFLMVNMKDHPNVVCCDDLRFVQHEDGIGWDICVKLELLERLFASGRQVAEDAAVAVGTDICAALIACEENNLVHGHLLTGNILRTQDGHYKLGDIGVFCALRESVYGPVPDTPYSYMAPEIYNDRYNGMRTIEGDIYSLGLTMYRLLNELRIPFMPLLPQVPSVNAQFESGYRRFRGEPLPAPAHGDPELQRIVLKACAPDPKDRYHSAREMLSDLMAYQEGSVDERKV